MDMLLIIISDPGHPITSKLKVNLRATDISKKYCTSTANTEAFKNTFIQKYLRLIRDKCVNLYLPRQLKDYNTKIVTIVAPTPSQPTPASRQLTKPEKTKISCSICNHLVKPGSGLTSHQRISKLCMEKAATYTSQEILNSINITVRKSNSNQKTSNSATIKIHIPDSAALFFT